MNRNIPPVLLYALKACTRTTLSFFISCVTTAGPHRQVFEVKVYTNFSSLPRMLRPTFRLILEFLVLILEGERNKTLAD